MYSVIEDILYILLDRASKKTQIYFRSFTHPSDSPKGEKQPKRTERETSPLGFAATKRGERRQIDIIMDFLNASL
jgi:hypothetical protein